MKTLSVACGLCLLVCGFAQLEVDQQVVLLEEAKYTAPRSNTYDLEYTSEDGSKQIVACPIYFQINALSNDALVNEVKYIVETGTFSPRVLLEILFLSLQYGHTGTRTEFRHFSTKLSMWDMHKRNDDYCTWHGITCNAEKKVTGIWLEDLEFTGTLPTELSGMDSLEVLDLKRNNIHGTIPKEWDHLKKLKVLNLEQNNIEGAIPDSLSKLTGMESLRLSHNLLTGSIPIDLVNAWPNLYSFELSRNHLVGKLPNKLLNDKPQLVSLVLSHNSLSGPLPEDISTMSNLLTLDLTFNLITGSIPTEWKSFPKLIKFRLMKNKLTGQIPAALLELSNLEELLLNDNQLSGPIPRGDDEVPGKLEYNKMGGKWGSMSKLKVIHLQQNQLSGILPVELCYGLGDSLEKLNIGFNRFSGTLPSTFGELTKLRQLDGPYNSFTGTLPKEMKYMSVDMIFNFTENRLTGSIPRQFCASGPKQILSARYKILGCEMILCPGSTFHPDGAGNMYGACRLCNHWRKDRTERHIMGKTTCPGIDFIHGDINGDGLLNEREILRLIYAYNIGHNWGPKFTDWHDPFDDPCALNGVTCTGDKVAKIDISDAQLCSTRDRKSGPDDACLGIPSEIALLNKLEVLIISRRQHFRGTLPTELGKLSSLTYLDISNSLGMKGPIPSELGLLTNLKYLNLGGCRFNESIPDELYELSNLEILNLSMNFLKGHISPNIRKLRKVKELMMSRTLLSGSLPTDLGNLRSLENLEMYGNRFSGTIPPSLSDCTLLKRIDMFNNQLTGTIPQSLSKLTSLQILHVKLNRLTGTIPSHFGELPLLSWFDVSFNNLYGTIPTTFGSSKSIKDFRLGGNMIYEPIPQALCSNNNINGGVTLMNGCDGVICPLGTYSSPGHATHNQGCKPCPEGQTTMYLGAEMCTSYSERDILSMLFLVMGGEKWDEHHKLNVLKDSVSVCEWKGLDCDEKGELTSIQLPTAGLDDQDLFYQF